MKTLLKLLIVIIALITTLESFAQIKFGVKGGLNVSNMLDKTKYRTYSDEYNSKIGFHLGATAEYSLSEKFSIEPGFLFSTKGYKMEKSGVTGSLNLNYLEVPINAIYKIELSSVNILISAGPYLGSAISGKAKASEPILGVNEDSKEQKIEIGTDIKALDFGLDIGAGVEIKDITLNLQYGLGLANLTPNTENDAKLKNRVIGISIGYKFGGK
jgi:hypothetical protein